MNRAQRRAAKKKGQQVTKSPVYNMSQDALKEIVNKAYQQGQQKGQEVNMNDALVEGTMHCIAISLKVLHEQYGFGPKRLTTFANQWIEEYNEGDMSIAEIEQWCWDYGGVKFRVAEADEDDEAITK